MWFDYVCLGECYYWQEDLVSVQYARPGEPDRAGLPAALRKHCLVQVVSRVPAAQGRPAATAGELWPECVSGNSIKKRKLGAIFVS